MGMDRLTAGMAGEESESLQLLCVQQRSSECLIKVQLILVTGNKLNIKLHTASSKTKPNPAEINVCNFSVLHMNNQII